MRVRCKRVPRLNRCTLLLAVVLTLSTLLLGHYYIAVDPRATTWVGASEPQLDVVHLGPKSLPELGRRVGATANKRQKNFQWMSQQVKGNVSLEKLIQKGVRSSTAVLQYEHDILLKSHCIDSVQPKIKGDSHFGSIFRMDVPVLMWDKHFTSWDQLEKKSPPYGWKGLPKSLISSTLKLLNHSANSRMFDANSHDGCVRCAVIGNGGILNGSRQGKAIDAHDYVFRLNGAVIQGFEEDVGTKTSFYGFTVNSMKNSLIAYYLDGFTKVPQSKDLRYIFIPAEAKDYLMLKSAILGVAVPEGSDKDDKPWNYFGPEASSHKFKILHPDFVSYLTERFLKSDLLNSKLSYLYMPSTGALMLLSALHTCDQVSAYGFITDNYNDFSDHYYERTKKPLLFYANHDMLMEAILWKSLHQRGLLWLYQR